MYDRPQYFAEYKFLCFWLSCYNDEYGFEIDYYSYEKAEDAIKRHKFNNINKKTRTTIIEK